MTPQIISLNEYQKALKGVVHRGAPASVVAVYKTNNKFLCKLVRTELYNLSHTKDTL